VLAAELEQVKLGGNLVARIAEASDARTVLTHTFQLISVTLLSRPELLRLIQFNALEMSDELDPLVHSHLSQLVEVLVRYLELWVIRGELRCSNAKALVLSLIGIILSYRPLARLFAGDRSGLESMFGAFAGTMALISNRDSMHSPCEGASS
jgi:hypothetical protein